MKFENFWLFISECNEGKLALKISKERGQILIELLIKLTNIWIEQMKIINTAF